MTTATITFRIHPVPESVISAARERGVDANGRRVEHLTAEGGEPLRCCLSNALPGEALVLFGFSPELPDSPYRETGPILAHAHRCAGPASTSTYPPDWYARPQVLRAYDERGWIHEATTMHDGTDPEAAIEAVLREPGVVAVHSRNVLYGCYMFTVTRV